VNNGIEYKKVVITGGIKRIGLAIAEGFFSAGYNLKLHYNSSSEDTLRDSSAISAEMIQCDFAVAERDDLKKLVEGCDILINNASVYWTEKNPIKISDYEVIQKKINYDVPVRLMDLFAEENVNRHALIINILDSLALCNSNSDSYSNSKYMLAQATKEYAVKLAPNIRVNGIAPGPVLPPEWAPDSVMEKSVSNMLLNYPPLSSDIASACVFLAETKSITGEIIRIDSGFSLNTSP